MISRRGLISLIFVNQEYEKRLDSEVHIYTNFFKVNQYITSYLSKSKQLAKFQSPKKNFLL